MNRDLETIAERIAPADRGAAEAAQRRLDDKTKPLGSLGRLEEIAVRLASIHRSVDFVTHPRAVVVMAADHGVARRGVSAYPAEVTAQMVHNFAAGGAAINVLARQMNARTVLVDMGVAGEPAFPAAVRRAGIASGTDDMTVGPAMTEAGARRAVAYGAALAEELAEDGVRLLVTGDMGIGNTTAAAALTAVFTGRAAEEVTGRGTGVDDRALAGKIGRVREALERNRPSAARPLAALAAVGGLEIAGLAGLVLGGAARRVPVVLDGFVSGAAALVAAALVPAARETLFAGHRSPEPGHAAVLQRLDLEPILDLRMRLGEGTGGVLALAVLDAAARILAEMASFESAGVSRGGAER